MHQIQVDEVFDLVSLHFSWSMGSSRYKIHTQAEGPHISSFILRSGERQKERKRERDLLYPVSVQKSLVSLDLNRKKQALRLGSAMNLLV